MPRREPIRGCLGGAALVGCVRLRLRERYDNDRLKDDGALLDLDFEERFLAQAQGSLDVRRHGDPPAGFMATMLRTRLQSIRRLDERSRRKKVILTP